MSSGASSASNAVTGTTGIAGLGTKLGSSVSGSSASQIDAKREEFRKYLEKEGVMETLTKALVKLYEEPEKPSDAVSFLSQTFSSNNAASDLAAAAEAATAAAAEAKHQEENTRKENERLQEKLVKANETITRLTEENATLSAKLDEVSHLKDHPIVTASVISNITIPEKDPNSLQSSKDLIEEENQLNLDTEGETAMETNVTTLPELDTEKQPISEVTSAPLPESPDLAEATVKEPIEEANPMAEKSSLTSSDKNISTAVTQDQT